MASNDRVKLATIPANTRGSSPKLIGRGERDTTTGSISVIVPKYRSYRPPEGWQIVGVYASDGRAKVYVERRRD